MRIRSIKPEFWRSDDIAALDWATRLLFIGLWSYVDDNGVGRDEEKLIRADLFPLEEDPRETLATISRGLRELSRRGLIYRYDVGERHFLQVATWGKHQRIDKPNKPRFPQYDAIRDTLATPSLLSRETLAPGTEEQRNRGTEERKTRERSSRSYSPKFEEFWKSYPQHRRKEKPKAWSEWKQAIKRESPEAILAGLRTFIAGDVTYAPYPAKWLKNDSWNDGPSQSSPQRSSVQPDVLEELGRMDELAGNGPAIDPGQFSGAPFAIGR